MIQITTLPAPEPTGAEGVISELERTWKEEVVA